MAVTVDFLQLNRSSPRLVSEKEQLHREDTALTMEVRRTLRIKAAFSFCITSSSKIIIIITIIIAVVVVIIKLIIIKNNDNNNNKINNNK